MLYKLPLVPFIIINLTRLTAGVCMKVRFKSKVTRGFFFSMLCDLSSQHLGSLYNGSRKTCGTSVMFVLLATEDFVVVSAFPTRSPISHLR